MITIHFKDVGQGDSIIVEWMSNNEKMVGIIDCHKYNDFNPTLEFLKANQISKIEFIVLTHFHYDHFSGMADVFEFCLQNNVKVKYFYHTIAPFVADIYNRVFKSQKLQFETKRFIECYDLFDSNVGDKIPVTHQIKALKLNDRYSMSFLAPQGKTYDKMSRQLARKAAKISAAISDINKLSTIIVIEDEVSAILLTGDAVKNSFKKNRGRLTKEIILSQVPHHGSWKNIDQEFWLRLKRPTSTSVVFSVGDEPKDKLPNELTVEFFDKNGFEVFSTNSTYGIDSYFKLGAGSVTSRKSSILNTVSRLRRTSSFRASSKYEGDKKFNFA